MKILARYAAITGLALAAAGHACAQVEQIQVIVPGEVEVESTSGKAVIAALRAAENEGAKNAWRAIKMRPEIALKVRNFTADQNSAMVSAVHAQCQVLLLDNTIDKKLKRVAARFRFDCNQQELIVGVDQQLRQSSRAPEPGGPERPRLASFFLVKEVASTTAYDADIDRSARITNRVGITDKTSQTAQYQTDDRMRAKGAQNGRISQTESWGENGDGVTDSLATRSTVNAQGRVEARGKSAVTVSSSSDTAATIEASQRQQGRTISRAATSTFRSTSPEELNSQLTDVLKNAGVRVTQYSDIYGTCPGPNPDTITKEFGAKDEDLSTPLRTGIVRAARACGFKYLVIGEALVDSTQVDPVSGAPKTTVILRARLWSIAEQIPEIVGTIQKDASGSNSNQNTARSNAVFQAAQRTGEEILSRMTSEGVR
jgi:hypothetical protein